MFWILREKCEFYKCKKDLLHVKEQKLSMGSVEVESNVNVKKSDRNRLDSISKLHDLVHKLEEDEGIPPSPTKTRDNLFENHVNGDIKEVDEFSLENVKPLNEFAIDTDLESEDSW